MDEELVRLQMREEQLERRVKKLEEEVAAVTGTMRTGKGVLFGIIFILGSAGLAIGTGIKKLWGIE